ncbi:6853_t:CDS:2 [Entrophospora sp. SA101]|nr:6853_t:CDS:2 [Entrophospora sp. SA101]
MNPKDSQYQQHILRLKNIPNTKFITFVPATGSWVFEVEDFTINEGVKVLNEARFHSSYEVISTICPEDLASQADINTSYSQQIDRLQDEAQQLLFESKCYYWYSIINMLILFYLIKECDNNEMTEDSLIEFENNINRCRLIENGNCHRRLLRLTMKNMLEKLDEKDANISHYNKVAEKKATEIIDIEKSLFEIFQQLNEFRPDPNLNLIIGPNEGRSAFMFAIALGLGCNTLVRNLNVLYHYANLLMKISYIRRFLKDIRNISHFIKDGQNHASIKIELKHDDDNVIIICLITRADNRTQWTLNGKFFHLW